MKKALHEFLALIAVIFVFAGCSANESESVNGKEKQCRIEIISADNNQLLAVIDDQKTIKSLLNFDKWEETEQSTEVLVPEYNLAVYQEKTLLYGQDPDEEREYEIIEQITTYKNSSYTEVAISGNVIKGLKIPEEFLTLYYTMADSIRTKLQKVIQNADVHNTEKTVVSLTAEQIDQVNEAFRPIFGGDADSDAVNPISHFFTSYYDNVQNIDFDEFLYCFESENDISKEEFETLKTEVNGFLAKILNGKLCRYLFIE